MNFRQPQRTKLLLASVCAVLAFPSFADNSWPSKPITFVQPYAPGGTSDVLARLIGTHLQQRLGQPVIVESKPGAGGNIGTDYVAKAKPDGYTFLVSSSGPIVISGALYPKLPYKPESDLTPISPIARAPFVLAVTTKSGLASVKDVIAKGKTDALNFGSAGSGSPQHIIGEMFNVAAGTRMQHIPYKGSGPLLTDLVGGQVSLAFENPLPLMPQVKAGNIRVLAVTSGYRAKAFPDTPTLAEAGVPGFDAVPWYGLFGPKGLPLAIATKLNTEVQAVLALPEVKARLEDLGAEAFPQSINVFQALIGTDVRKWSEAVKASGATVD